MNALALVAALAAQVIEGAVPDDGLDYFEVPFVVDDGVAEIEIAHAPVDDDDVLDWGLFDPDGVFRGYGGGNLEPAVVGELAASRSYLPGAITPGTWHVLVGKARLVSAAPAYRIEVTLRETPTLPPDPDRAAWRDTVLETGPRFYAGDFHVHSEDSGDADATLDEIATLALARGLDFVVITDHNTNAQIDRLLAAQERAGGALLFVPGVEFTTYQGHATGFGVTDYVDHRIGVNGRTVDDAASEMDFFSINHPTLDLGDVCIGCAWTAEIPANLHGVEVQTGRTLVFTDAAIAFWERLLDDGRRLVPIGGSDDHNAGRDNAAIAEPTTLVFADELSVAGLRAGLAAGRTVVKLQDPTDPMVDMTASGGVVTAVVTGGVGKTFRFIEDGLGLALPVPIDTDPQTFTVERAPLQQRVRVEIADADGTPRTLTSYVWLEPAPEETGCGCGATPDVGLACLAVILARSRRWRRSNGSIDPQRGVIG